MVLRSVFWAGDAGNAFWFFVASFIAIFAPNVYQFMSKTRPVLLEFSGTKIDTLKRFNWKFSAVNGIVVVLAFCYALNYQTEVVEFLYFQF